MRVICSFQPSAVGAPPTFETVHDRVSSPPGMISVGENEMSPTAKSGDCITVMLPEV